MHISVILAVRDGEEFLDDALRSAAGAPKHELIAVDDGSRDRTPQILESAAAGIRRLRQTPRGLAAARNAGLAAATGRWIGFLDADDRMSPGGLDALLAAAETTGAEMVAGQASRIDRAGAPLPGRVGPPRGWDAGTIAWRNPFHVGALLVAREAIERAGGFCERLRACEDWDLWMQIVRSGGRVAVIDDVVSSYRSHDGQMSRDPRLMRDASLLALTRAFDPPSRDARWNARRDEAFLRAHLRCAARFLCAGMEEDARAEVVAAAAVDRGLLAEDAAQVREVFGRWETDASVQDLAAYRRGAERIIESLR